jgi:hypothetical protein
MHGLSQIVAMNRRASAKAGEDNFNRHCSFTGDSETGVVIHSAKQRATVFLPGRKLPFQSPAARFLRRWNSVNSAEARDHLVESFF